MAHQHVDSLAGLIQIKAVAGRGVFDVGRLKSYPRRAETRL